MCDAHQIHPHMRQGILVNPWSATAAATQMSGLISEWHYWTAQAQVQTWRAANGYANNIRPLLATETGQAYSGNGANLGSRTDIHQLRSLKYGQLAIGPLFYGACLNSFYSVGLSPAVDAQGVAGAFNLLLNDSSAWFTDTASKKDADYVAVSFNFSETSDQIPFVSKAWKDYWNHKTWLVWMANQQQTPLGTDINTCPFPEWNRVTFTSNQVAMAAGGRNVIAHAKQLRRGVHTFKAEVKLNNAGSQAALYVTGYDKLNGLASVKSNTLVGVQDWTLLSCSFSPRQHGNPRVPDPAIAVLRVEHNGTGTCYVRNPVVEMPGSITAPGNYFDIAVTDITWAPASVTAAMSVTFSATITNVGNSPSPAAAHEVSLFIDNVLFGTGTVSTSIAAQTARSQTISGTWTATGGTHALRAVSTFMTNEFSPDNNSFTKSIVVASDLYFDLTVSDITWIPASPKAGDLVSFTAAVQNIGTDVSPSGVPTGVKFSVDGVMASFSDNITTGIAAGVTRQQTANGPAASGGMWTATEGTHSVVAWVDDVNRFPTERDKTNNTRTEFIVVTAGSHTSTGYFSTATSS